MQNSQDLSNNLPVAGIYQHYKGQLYQVFSCARHSETEEWHVVYQCLYGDYSVWIRPVTMFTEQVQLADHQWAPRFTFKIASSITV